MAHVPHPPQCQIKTVHLGDFLLPHGTERCLEEVKIAARYNLLHVNKITLIHGGMSSRHSAINQPCPVPVLKQYKQSVNSLTLTAIDAHERQPMRRVCIVKAIVCHFITTN